MNQAIGEMIRYQRKKRSWSQQNLASVAGVGKTVVFDIEHGKTTVKFETLLKILRVLDIRLLFRTAAMDVEFKES